VKTNKKNLTKIDIIKNINKQFSLPSKFSEKLINDTFNLIIEMVLKSKKVKIKNFGTFSFLEKNSRQGRNPKTKELFLIKSRKVISFKVAKFIKNKLNK